ncbi:MAG: 2-oxoglutarate dehydrogenase complex dihydrolipoyllysine-residue succinyltransferase [Anaerolineae bacterium]|nr:2-oxoglutarate dehydrogenase complex dihydrolipoyllysine-residue succinyltransferase [Anaerolineae bacterium]
MSVEIKVPDLGESVVEATVGRWLKNVGDPVKAGEALVELETDKVNLEVTAEKAGILGSIAHPQGDDVKIGEVLCVIEEGSAASVPSVATTAAAAPTAAVVTPSAEVQVVATNGSTAAAGDPSPKIAATPVAKNMATAEGVDLTKVPASGAKVTKNDVEKFVESQKSSTGTSPKIAASPAPAVPIPTVSKPVPPPPPEPNGDSGYRRDERVKMSRRRRTIAQRLVEAQHTAAMLTTFNEVDMSAVQGFRAKYKESFQTKHNTNLGMMSFFVKATIGALKAFPRLNAELQGDDMILKHYYDIGIAVGAAEGLVVPVLRDADRLSFAEIESSIKRFAKQAETNTLSLEDLRGGTFTITNGGVFGSMLSTPILNAPQVGILGLHKIEQRPVVVNGEIVIRPMMYVALSYDHRIVDGSESVRFLVRVKELLEDLNQLMLEG